MPLLAMEQILLHGGPATGSRTAQLEEALKGRDRFGNGESHPAPESGGAGTPPGAAAGRSK